MILKCIKLQAECLTKGSNQADTIEQRCRFYGYRKKYIDFCRVYITNGLKDDYINYNKHEKELHDYLSNHTLLEFLETGSRMMMNSGLIPTNMSRISEKIISSHLKGFQSFEPQDPYLKTNDNLTKKFIKLISSFSQKDLLPKREDHQKVNVTHRVTKVPMKVLIDYLVDFEINNKFEIIKKSNILRYIESLMSIEKDCWIIEMAYKRESARERTINFTQSPKNAKNQFSFSELAAGNTKFTNGEVYFGDRKLLIDTDSKSLNKFNYNNELIVQIHNIKAAKATKSDVSFKGKTFYTLAFNFPDKFATRYISKIKNT